MYFAISADNFFGTTFLATIIVKPASIKLNETDVPTLITIAISYEELITLLLFIIFKWMQRYFMPLCSSRVEKCHPITKWQKQGFNRRTSLNKHAGNPN
jgi:hypothetical protein